MTKLRLIVLSHMYPSKLSPIKGIFVHQQVRHLIAAGCEIMVISPVPFTPSFLATNQQRKEYRAVPGQDVIDGVPIIYPRYLRLPGSLFHAPSVFTMYASAYPDIHTIVKKFRPQLIHAYAATPDGYVSLLLSRKFKIPAVVSLLGSDINVYPFRDRWTLRLTKKVLAKAHGVIAVSKALRATAETIAQQRRSIEVVYMGCELKEFTFNAESRDAIRQRLGISRDSVVLVFVGHVLQEKGVNELMQAFYTLANNYRELHLVVVGQGPALETLASHTKKAEVASRVHLVGQRPHQEISDWLSGGDILVLPSWHEGLPNVVVEAMACSRPVVATKVGGIPEAIESKKSGILVEKGNVNALTQAIAELVTSPVRREAMGQIGRQIVEQRFTWRANAEKTIEVYHKVLNEH